MNQLPLLRVENLVVTFKGEASVTKAVDGISFDLYPGETIGIVGESGSGKSVTALSILRLIDPPAGKIESGSIQYAPNDRKPVDLLHLTEKEMQSIRGKEISMIFQEPMTSLNPVLTCGYQVAEVLLRHLSMTKKEAKTRTVELFNEVKLPRAEEIFHSYPHQLSGGQKQRVMIAMAIACNPKVLIADEPTTALDVTVQKTILDLLKELQVKHGMSILFITHDLGLVSDFADKILVMYKGNLVEEGSTASLFSHPKHPYTQGLLSCRPPLNVRLRRLKTVQEFMGEGKREEGKREEGKKGRGKREEGKREEGKREEGGETSNFRLQTSDLGLQTSDLGPETLDLGDIITSEERRESHQKIYSQPPILEINELVTRFPVSQSLFGRTKHYLNAVDRVSFRVYPGETLGIVGESGCGKTTLGRTILNLVKASSGNILYEGRELSKLSSGAMREMRKELQIIFQDPYSSLNPRLMVGAAILEPMKVHGLHGDDCKRKEVVLELLHKVGLDENHYHRYPHEFSGGQRQRVCIARALALQPKLIICDESVSALDVSIQAQVLNLLNDLKREFNFTYLFISHDLSVVRFMSDRLIVMKAGKIEEMGDSDEIYAHPVSPYTRQLLEAIPKVFEK